MVEGNKKKPITAFLHCSFRILCSGLCTTTFCVLAERMPVAFLHPSNPPANPRPRPSLIITVTTITIFIIIIGIVAVIIGNEHRSLVPRLRRPVDALSVLERLSPSPVLWWNLLIRQDITDGRLDHSLSLLRRMQLVGTRPDHFTLPFALKACGELPSYRRGSSLHGMVCTNGFKSNVFVCNSLLAMYARCGALDEARRVFNEIVVGGIDDLISWNSMVAAFVKGGNPRLALELFADMASKIPNKAFENRRSDVISLVNILPACASLRAYTQAKEIHGYAIRNLLFSDIFVGNAIIDVYAKCGVMEGACKVFNTMEVKDVVSWNAMVTGYSQNGNFDDALELFEKMREDNIALNVVTWSAMIAGYAQRGMAVRR
uniref:Pentatricopeptide repeat-containing protein n=1 Tax=Ananas comosus var. bracteatus TaxID=296719 RepID=A0A6V7P1J8_ANACO|nr:unnamed protein product [Ananas comosus var. bracteatus]